SRSAKGDLPLGVLVRERQDLVAEYQRLDTALSTAVEQSLYGPDRRAETRIGAQLAARLAGIRKIDKQLKEVFPDYVMLTSPVPASVEDVQRELREDE